jgi:hypothetical protein
MKKSLLIESLLAIAAASSSLSATAAPKDKNDDTIIAVYPADTIAWGHGRLVRVETVGSRKARNGTKVYVPEHQLPDRLPETPAPAATPR